MKRLLFLLVISAFGFVAFGQAKVSCNCPAGQDLAHQGAPEKVFYFSNGKIIGLCGDFEKVDKDTVYSEVILYHCGMDGFFRGWDGIQTCTIRQEGDTIVVRRIVGLPVGKNMEVVSTQFKVEKYFYRGPRFVVHSVYPDVFPKYTSAQIADVLGQYAKLKRGDDEALLVVARRLAWAYISGSGEADGYLSSFEEKFGPFMGVKGDEFSEIHGMYWFWKMDHLMGGRE